jgi:rhodanese-related sulfurtransferase
LIRDRLKSAVKKVAIKAFGMEWQAEDIPENEALKKRAAPASIDPSVIPRVVDGSGDTPGPKHLEKIGRTWLASQVISNVSPFIIDVRHPKECVAGLLPGAVLLPGEQVKSRLDLLPGKDVRVTVYDQTGGELSDQLATWLRGQGWGLARMLQGGFAEWIEHSEPIATPQAPEGGKHHLGSPVEVKKVGRGYVQGVEGGKPVYTVLLDDGTVRSGVKEKELAG